jgi:inorganic pyrophosphatase
MVAAIAAIVARRATAPTICGGYSEAVNHNDRLWPLLGVLFKAHPWHGVPIGEQAPAVLTAYVEIVPTDTVKYEVDKTTGHLRVDRPQRFSNVCPTLYGFVPQTYCGDSVAALCAERTGRQGIVGDGDPVDICILTERSISHGDVLVEARPIGGLRMLDGDEADDKIVAVLAGDAAYGGFEEIDDVPAELIERLRHYFLTYKGVPDGKRPTEITHIYGRAEAHEVVTRSRDDYLRLFGDLPGLLRSALRD